MSRIVVQELRSLALHKGMRIRELAVEINEFLEDGRKFNIEDGMKYFYVLMNPNSRDWRAPSGEIILAIIKTIEKLKNS
jgi:hypothetical protein